MADNITEAFEALQERWDAIFAREQARFAVVNQDLSMTVRDGVEQSRKNMQEAIREMADERYMRDAVHDPDYLAMMAAREEALDTPDVMASFQATTHAMQERLAAVEEQTQHQDRQQDQGRDD